MPNFTFETYAKVHLPPISLQQLIPAQILASWRRRTLFGWWTGPLREEISVAGAYFDGLSSVGKKNVLEFHWGADKYVRDRPACVEAIVDMYYDKRQLY
jgi:hypothetical protein